MTLMIFYVTLFQIIFRRRELNFGSAFCVVLFGYSSSAAVQLSLLYLVIHVIISLNLICAFVQVAGKLME